MLNSSPSLLNDDDEKALITYEDDLERMIGENLSDGQDIHAQNLFLAFQRAAKEVTKMFRERSNGNSSWTNFHAAAEAVTMLYKESLDSLKDAIELGNINGEHRKTKELLCWTRRKHRRYLSTEEIFHQLMGRSNSEYSLDNSTIISEDISCGASSINTNSSNPVLDDLQTFRQALVMNDSNQCSDTNPATICENSQQLDNFVCQQLANQLSRKRTLPSMDISNISPTNDSHKMKRHRYI